MNTVNVIMFLGGALIAISGAASMTLEISPLRALLITILMSVVIVGLIFGAVYLSKGEGK